MDSEYYNLLKYIESQSGIFIDESKLFTIKDKIDNRLTELRLDDLNEYIALIKDSDQVEFDILMDLITNKETYFFRNIGHFDLAINFIIPELLKVKTSDEKVYIWSCGCSTGEEPYTVAMMLYEKFPFNLDRFYILGTDISRLALARAVEGVYSERSFRNINPEVKEKFFNKMDEYNFKIDPKIRKRVILEQHNMLTMPFPPEKDKKWDLIFCRNVFIYFKNENIRKVVDNFFPVLNDDGYLIVGHSETINQITDRFLPLIVRDTFVFQKNISREKKDIQRFKREALEDKVSLELATAKMNKKPVNYYVVEESVKLKQIQKRVRRFKKLYDKLMDLFFEEKFDDARKIIEKKISEYRDNDDFLFLAAHIYASLGKYDRALEKCNIVLQKNPTSKKTYFLLGIINLETGNFEEAVKNFKRVIFLDDSSYLAHFQLALSYYHLRKTVLAEKEYYKTISLLKSDPENEFETFKKTFNNEQLLRFCKFSLDNLQKQGKGFKHG